MIVFMRTFFQMVKKHEAELLAVGASQVLIDGLEGHYVALTKANDLQEFAKRQRIIQTDHRITVYNELWDIITNICRVGKIVFYNNYGKYRQYVLYKGAGSGSDVLSGDVPAEGTVVILDQNITPETNFKLHNTGTTVLKFCLENNTGECTGGIELSAVEQQEHTALQIGTGTILKCTNKSTTEEGKYEVEVS